MWLTMLHRVVERDEGQDLTEYALLIALIVIATFAAIRALGGSVSVILGQIATILSGVLGGS